MRTAADAPTARQIGPKGSENTAGSYRPGIDRTASYVRIMRTAGASYVRKRKQRRIESPARKGSFVDYPVEIVKLASLKPHPKNYREHPQDEIDHLKESLRAHGFYRNIVLAKDDTVLAGHGVLKAARQLGFEEGPALRLPLDPDDPAAIKVLVADNEIAHLVESNDRLLSELLREIKDNDLSGLLGTGYDEMMLANLVFVTRPESEINTLDEAAHWVGMPEYDAAPEPWKIVVNFEDMEDREDFAKRLGVTLTEQTKYMWWPPKEREDVASLKLRG